jgi:LuxR family maltose regulon positive regulatory protein
LSWPFELRGERGSLREPPPLPSTTAPSSRWTVATGKRRGGSRRRPGLKVEAGRVGEQVPGVLTDAVAARLAMHWGDPEAARAHLAHAQRLRPLLTRALPWGAVRARLDLAHAHLALADAPGARTLLAEIRDVLARRPQMGALTDELATIQRQVDTMRGDVIGASTLTTAELRLLPLLTTHLSFREIGTQLFVSHNTVKTQAISIYRKLDATSRSEAIERAVQVGLLESTAPAHRFIPSG